ncbi:MAG: PEP-CTERM sorting domain-containing protein [Colwellia sp.]|nr:PEP-CTERM sorting domain-containing protein [Colwellia sp.]
MSNLVVNTLILFIFLSFSSISQATLITNLTQAQLDAGDYSQAEDQLVSNLLGVNYIYYQGYDWAWVSPVNLEDYYGQNTLYAPSIQVNWKFADFNLLNILKTKLSLADFTDSNGNIIQAAEFFNSDFDYVDADNFKPESISSEWIAPDAFMASFFGQYETFYVRESSNSNHGPTPVPEPSTLLIFALALITLANKKRLFS